MIFFFFKNAQPATNFASLLDVRETSSLYKKLKSCRTEDQVVALFMQPKFKEEVDSLQHPVPPLEYGVRVKKITIADKTEEEMIDFLRSKHLFEKNENEKGKIDICIENEKVSISSLLLKRESGLFKATKGSSFRSIQLSGKYKTAVTLIAGWLQADDQTRQSFFQKLSYKDSEKMETLRELASTWELQGLLKVINTWEQSFPLSFKTEKVAPKTVQQALELAEYMQKNNRQHLSLFYQKWIFLNEKEILPSRHTTWNDTQRKDVNLKKWQEKASSLKLEGLVRFINVLKAKNQSLVDDVNWIEEVLPYSEIDILRWIQIKEEVEAIQKELEHAETLKVNKGCPNVGFHKQMYNRPLARNLIKLRMLQDALGKEGVQIGSYYIEKTEKEKRGYLPEDQGPSFFHIYSKKNSSYSPTAKPLSAPFYSGDTNPEEVLRNKKIGTYVFIVNPIDGEEERFGKEELYHLFVRTDTKLMKFSVEHTQRGGWTLNGSLFERGYTFEAFIQSMYGKTIPFPEIRQNR